MVYDFALQRLIYMYLAIGTGLFVMGLMVLTYIEIWRPRREPAEPRGAEAGLLRWWVYSIPWVATITFFGLWLFSVAYAIYRMFNPVDW